MASLRRRSSRGIACSKGGILRAARTRCSASCLRGVAGCAEARGDLGGEVGGIGGVGGGGDASVPAVRGGREGCGEKERMSAQSRQPGWAGMQCCLPRVLCPSCAQDRWQSRERDVVLTHPLSIRSAGLRPSQPTSHQMRLKSSLQAAS